jgi:hypothetical protein
MPCRRLFAILAFLVQVGLPAPAQEKSVRPGINKPFEDPNVKEFVGKFEVESREIYSKRKAILENCKLKPGVDVADVGAGTGLFTRLFAEAVGPKEKRAGQGEHLPATSGPVEFASPEPSVPRDSVTWGRVRATPPPLSCSGSLAQPSLAGQLGRPCDDGGALARQTMPQCRSCVSRSRPHSLSGQLTPGNHRPDQFLLKLMEGRPHMLHLHWPPDPSQLDRPQQDPLGGRGLSARGQNEHIAPGRGELAHGLLHGGPGRTAHGQGHGPDVEEQGEQHVQRADDLVVPQLPGHLAGRP